MKIEDNCVEYRSQQHEMLVEGTADFKPTENQIMEHGAKNGFFVTDIEIWFDNMQGFWRWNGNIIPLK